MKRGYIAVSSLIIAVLMLTGCDAFRRLAGRPTSKDIHAMRVEILEEDAAAAAEEARQKAVMDSIALAERLAAESEAIMDSLKSEGRIISPNKLGGVDPASLKEQYYIVIGSFKDRANADRLAAKVGEAGYPATVIILRTGMNAVGICGTNDVHSLNESLKKVRKESFCPKEAWVLVKE